MFIPSAWPPMMALTNQPRLMIEASLCLSFGYRPPNGHHQRNRAIDLLLGPQLGRIQVAAPIRLADHVPQTPFQRRITMMPQPPRAHRGELGRSSSDPIRWRPCANAGQRYDTGNWISKER